MIACMVSIAAPCWAHPPFITQADLLAKCSAVPASQDWGICLGYIVGVADALHNDVTLGGSPVDTTFPSCGGTPEMLRVRVMNFLLAHPQSRNDPASDEVDVALGSYCNSRGMKKLLQ